VPIVPKEQQSGGQPPAQPSPRSNSQSLQQAQVPVDWSSQIADVMQNQFGLKPRVQNVMYRPPYPAHYDMMPYPHRYRIPEFTKFTGQDDVSTVEHVSRFLIQCGEAANVDALRVHCSQTLYLDRLSHGS